MGHRTVLCFLFALLFCAAGQVVQAQSWGMSSPRTWSVYGCPWGASTPSVSVEAAIQCVIDSAASLAGPRNCTGTNVGYHGSSVICDGDGSARPIIYNGVCPNGSNLVPSTLECIPTVCISQSGQSFAFDKVQDGNACTGPRPESVCFADGCRGIVVSGSRLGFTMADGSTACLFDGVARITSLEPCQSNEVVVRKSSSSPVQQDEQAVSAGGAGVSGAGTQSLDSINLAKIATNTAKIAGTLAGDGTTGGGGTGSGSVFEGEEGTPLSEGAALVAGAIEENQVPSNAPLLASPPDVGSASRWLLNLATFRGNYAAQCAHSWTVQLPVIGEQHFELDFCPWAQYVKTFLYWAFGIWTAYALWSTVYSSQRKA